MKSLQLWPVVTLGPDAGQTVAFDAGPDRAIYLLQALRPMDYRDSAPGASFAKIHPASPQRYRARGWLDGVCVLDTTIEDERYNLHAIQPLGDDLLLACARSSPRGGDSHLNGRVYSRDGRLLRELALGDAIEHLQTSARAQIWAGYFDEGIFGGDPLSKSGLIAMDAQGAPTFRYRPEAGLDIIVDCYALNVASAEETWVCYYSQFPLVLVRDQRIARSWRVPVRGADAFAVFRDHALFHSGHGETGRYHLLRLDTGEECTEVAQFRLLDEDGAPLHAQRVTARGDTVYLLRGGDLYACDIHQAIAAFAA